MVVIMPELDVFEIKPNEELIYRGEGNSSLVVALKSKRKVIRLLKSDAKKLKNDEDVQSLLLQHIDFNVNILPDTLPLYFYSKPQLISLTTVQLEQIKSLVNDKRPSFRLDKTISNCEYALLMPDYCCIPKCIAASTCATGPVLSIEIKPKQGFLPMLNLFKNDPQLSIKSQICRFGLSQFYKLQKQSITGISSYCPKNLFTGCYQLGLDALYSLLESPQNNFRVFCDAQLIYGDQFYGKARSVEHLQMVLAHFLLPENYAKSSNYVAAAAAAAAAANTTRRPIGKLPLKEQNGAIPNNTISNLLHSASSSVNKKAHSKVIESFCKLLLDALYNNEFAKATKSRQPSKEDSQRTLLNEFAKQDQFTIDEEHRYLYTFIQMFETDFVGCTPNSANDINNNQILFPTYNATATTGAILNQAKSLTESTTTNQVGRCLLHHNSNRVCFESGCSHTLPKGCVLDWILRAQMLDSLDSLMAVELFDKLCEQYRKLKHQYLLDSMETDQSMNKEMYDAFVGKFIFDNLSDLQKLWCFLISLTAKDCSIMVAIQRADCSPPPTPVQQQGPFRCILMTDTETGVQYVCSISITDLDFKQAYKIQRMLHNDRRMINAFWAALQADTSMFPSELVKMKKKL